MMLLVLAASGSAPVAFTLAYEVKTCTCTHLSISLSPRGGGGGLRSLADHKIFEPPVADNAEAKIAASCKAVQ